MRDLRKHEKEVRSRIAKAKRIALMSDFDGVLAPIVKDYGNSEIDPKTKKLLKECARFCFVAVISGRELKVLRQKVGVKGIAYAGNHGFEWRVGGKNFKVHLSAGTSRVLRVVSKELLTLVLKYPGARLEDKGMTISLHYRRVPVRYRQALSHEAKRVLEPYTQRRELSVLEGKEIYDIRPRIAIHKGTVARLMLSKVPGALPIFIGDDVTDEDAFRAFPKGITIRIGRTQKSSARYVLNSRKEVNTFLEGLISARTQENQVQ